MTFGQALALGIMSFVLVIVVAMTSPGKGSDYDLPTVSENENAYTQPQLT